MTQEVMQEKLRQLKYHQPDPSSQPDKQIDDPSSQLAQLSLSRPDEQLDEL
jgi:hypothetical protein